MPIFLITEEVYYTGRETVEYRIEADSEHEAECLADNEDVEQYLGFFNIDIDSEGIKIEEYNEPEPRCDKTPDMFE